jgi:ribosomal protein S6--L-glutamate ligase
VEGVSEMEGIGILYESKEWSVYALEKYINAMGVPARLVDMQLFDIANERDMDELLSFDMIVNRVFASSVFRGHHRALEQTELAIGFLRERSVPMINSYEAHYYEISKERQANALAAHGLPVPRVYGVFTPAQMIAQARAQPTMQTKMQTRTQARAIQYPCIVKPDCGGRTHYTYIANNPYELGEAMKDAPDIEFVVQEYIPPEYGYITRIELIGGSCRLILKRSVTESGLSAYHLGSTYEPYDDCPEDIKDAAVRAMDLLRIEAGSLDVIENQNGFFIIDVNSVSNVSEDNTAMFSFDLMKETAAYIVKKYNAGIVSIFIERLC